MLLPREELIEQVHLFRTLAERMRESTPMQEVLASVRDEVLATTRLPMAIDFLLGELKHAGMLAEAMARLGHYFTPYQTFVMREAEEDRTRFDLRIALEILRFDSHYRAEGATPQGMFMYQFESISRNRLRYDQGLKAMSEDPMFDAGWRDWILTVRRQVGLVDLADMIYVRSEHYVAQQIRLGQPDYVAEKQVLFGEREGRIALANRKKEPLLMFAALQRQLGYPVVPRPAAIDDTPNLLPQLSRRVERLEARIKFLEDEEKGGFDLTKFYGPPKDE